MRDQDTSFLGRYAVSLG